MGPELDPQLDDNTVNQQPDANSGGSTFLTQLENTALNGINVLERSAASNVQRNPNFVGATAGQAPAIGSGFLILIVVMVLLLK